MIAAPLREEVLHHLPGHALRKGGNAFRARRRDRRRRRGSPAGAVPRLRGLLDQADLLGDRFQLAQAAERLGLVVNRRVELCCQRVVLGRDGFV